LQKCARKKNTKTLIQCNTNSKEDHSVSKLTHHCSGYGYDIINSKFSFETCMTIDVIPTTPTTKFTVTISLKN